MYLFFQLAKSLADRFISSSHPNYAFPMQRSSFLGRDVSHPSPPRSREEPQHAKNSGGLAFGGGECILFAHPRQYPTGKGGRSGRRESSPGGGWKNRVAGEGGRDMTAPDSSFPHLLFFPAQLLLASALMSRVMLLECSVG